MMIWMNGKLVDAQAATVSVFDHGLLYGDGVFEGIRVYSGRIFKSREHVTRLFDSARVIRLTIPYTPEQITEAMEQTIAANAIDDGYIRLVVTRGAGTLGISPAKCSHPATFIIADQIALYPPELYANGMHVIIASTMRCHPNTLSPRVKSLNYLNNIMAKLEAIDAGAPEAIMLNTEGMVSEATGDNIFIVRHGRLITPPVSAGVLEGITRQCVIDLAGEARVEPVEQNLTRYDLYTADECFLTGTAAEVIAVTRIDGRQIGDGKPGPITQRLTAAFHELVRREA